MPCEHFLRDLARLVDFDFIYGLVAPLYSDVGRPSVDPVIIVKSLLLGYLYGIPSERRLEQEIRVNIAYHWFLGLNLGDPVPDHSTFSQLRRRKFSDGMLFQKIFDEVVRHCIETGLVTGKTLVMDATHVRANACDSVTETITVEVGPSEYVR